MLNNRHKRGGGGTTLSKTVIWVLDCLLIVLAVALFIWNRTDEKKRTEQNNEIAQEYYAEQEELENILNERADSVKEAMSQYLPGIVCWGDSLTAGAGGDGTTYPNVLQSTIEESVLSVYDIESLSKSPSYSSEELEFSVVNMGVGGEGTNTILGRNGAIPFVVSETFTIPADTSSVKISFESSNGKSVAPLRQGTAGMSYVTISGVKGVISIEQESYISEKYTYYFQREESGNETTVKAGTEIVTQGSVENLNYIPVIFIGQNGGYDDIDELISQQKAIIEHQSGNPVNEDGTARFIIVGLHTGTAEDRAELEEAMEEEYGDNYINLREYMSTQAMTDAGLTPTDEDEEMMAEGKTPASLLVPDGLHFNATAYELIGNLIYQRMDELGYFDEVNEAISAAMQPIE